MVLLIGGGVVFSAWVVIYNITQVSPRQRVCPPKLPGRMNDPYASLSGAFSRSDTAFIELFRNPFGQSSPRNQAGMECQRPTTNQHDWLPVATA